MKVELIKGDSTIILPTLQRHSFDALITDPPYASGGVHRGDRIKSTAEKYLDASTKAEYIQHDFEGDQFDQRTWAMHTTHWLRLARDVIRPQGVFAVFIDWRQIA